MWACTDSATGFQSGHQLQLHRRLSNTRSLLRKSSKQFYRINCTLDCRLSTKLWAVTKNVGKRANGMPCITPRIRLAACSASLSTEKRAAASLRRESCEMIAACIVALVLQKLLAASAQAYPQLACLCAAAFFTRPVHLHKWRLHSSATTG